MDFNKYENQFQIFTSPLAVDVETVDENLQLGLIKIQCDFVLKQKWHTDSIAARARSK